jgi:hypothetical protein
MSWSDVKSLQQIKKLRDHYNIKTFIETGTFHGINAMVHAVDFDKVITIEINKDYYTSALNKLQLFKNVELILGDSPQVLVTLRPRIKEEPCVFIYLDAHFYDSSLPPKERWVILRELKALEGTPNGILAIHDFDNGLGHLVYDGIPMDFALLKDFLYNINPGFSYYTNTKNTCDIITKDRVKAGEVLNLVLDEFTADNLDYAWSDEVKTYRGILYCTPTPLDLSNFELIEL